MTHCSLDSKAVSAIASPQAGRTSDEVRLASRSVAGGLQQTELSVPGIHCGGCIRAIESALSVLPSVEHARVNLSTKRVTVRWRADCPTPPLLETLMKLGYQAHPHEMSGVANDPIQLELVRALAVAGFAASNIMLLSVSIWSGADASTRELFHWLSAGIAFPTLLYSGRVFFRSAWSALRHRRTNMDVPISIGVLLAFGLSFYETIHHGQHAYFDASVTLLLFLLIGRTLDHMVRERARSAVLGLARLMTRGATVLHSDGTRDYLPIEEITPGMTILLSVGDRVPVNGRIEIGLSDVDCSLVSGESEPRQVRPGCMLQAGTLNLTGALTISATAAAQDSFLAEMVRMMEAAELGRSSYRRIADRAARLYAPTVHLAAFLSFIGWVFATGDYHQAITVAVAVLIITCPCALGLAVPMVQVAASRRLFESGIMVKDGSGIERLSGIDTVVFDKTGTLTLSSLSLTNLSCIDPHSLSIAAAMGRNSNHPHSRTLGAFVGPDTSEVKFDTIHEHPGLGLEATMGEVVYRLGRAEWALGSEDYDDRSHLNGGTVLSADGRLKETFRFDDRVRSGAAETVGELRRMGLAVEIVSGDGFRAVQRIAAALDIPNFEAAALPGNKTARLATLADTGRKVLMVGDGLNDAPALAAAYASMAPASAVDVGRNAADFVFLRESLEVVPHAIAISRKALLLIRQNFCLAILYNAVALPVAVLGYVTPLVAALAMSGSSLIVVANAFRLGKGPERGQRAPASPVRSGLGTVVIEVAE